MSAFFYDEPGTFAPEDNPALPGEDESLQSVVDNAEFCEVHNRLYYCGECPVCQLVSAREYYRAEFARGRGLVHTATLTQRNAELLPLYEVTR